MAPGTVSGTPTPAAPATSTPAATAPAKGTGTFGAAPRVLTSPAPAASLPPERFVLPAASLDLPVVPTGVNEAGAMALPERPSTVGWYRFGPAPGAGSGAVVLAAHVDSRVFGIGPFALLEKLRRGDEVVVGNAAGQRRYAVVAVERVGKDALRTEELFRRTGPEVLHLVTCGGRFEPGFGYSDNVVVRAEPVR